VAHRDGNYVVYGKDAQGRPYRKKTEYSWAIMPRGEDDVWYLTNSKNPQATLQSKITAHQGSADLVLRPIVIE